MSTPFLAEVIMFGGNFAPRGWAFCNNQLLPISQNTALFSLLGTTWGGDGRTTFGLPRLQGRSPMGSGNGPGLSPRRLGQVGGATTNTLTVQTMASHTHAVTYTNTEISQKANTGNGADADPVGRYPSSGGGEDLYSDTASGAMAAPALAATTTVGDAGGTAASFTNLQPYQTVNFIIATVGTYPSRS